MRVYLNQKLVEVYEKTLFSAFPKKENTVFIINGFQTDEDVSLKENDEIYIIEKGVMPDRDCLEAIMAARHTPKVHKILKEGKVAVAGLGGLGSNIAVALARIGVGRLRLVDFDVVEPSNLNRQSYYIKHIGMFKTDALKEQLTEINPFIEVDTVNIRVGKENVKELFDGFDIICEAFDSPASKAELLTAVKKELPKAKLVCASGMAGYDSANNIKTAKVMKNTYLCGDFETEAKEGAGLMSPRVMICAGHQANMVLRLLMGIDEA